MKYVIVSVRDMAAECFAMPQYVAARGQAVRGLTDQVNSKEGGVVHDHPEHFVLYALGFFDDQSGKFEAHDPEQICLAVDLVKPDLDAPPRIRAVQ